MRRTRWSSNRAQSARVATFSNSWTATHFVRQFTSKSRTFGERECSTYCVGPLANTQQEVLAHDVCCVLVRFLDYFGVYLEGEPWI
jgi:hypothetical protein